MDRPEWIWDTIAHELYHAKQYDLTYDENSIFGEIYEKEFKGVQDPINNYAGYRAQLIEAEAHAFGTDIYQTRLFRMQGIITDLQEHKTR